ncbi:hypothetical protein HY478_02490 [Candidatus Uhrbacteria bacterium]|nr:hypothetical protein [Candidatus Uhrbacteria bacterium]
MTMVQRFLVPGDVPVVVTMLRAFPYTNGVMVAVVRQARRPIALVHEEFEFEDMVFAADYEIKDEEPLVPSHGWPVPVRLAYSKRQAASRSPEFRAQSKRGGCRNYGRKPRKPWAEDRRSRWREQIYI